MHVLVGSKKRRESIYKTTKKKGKKKELENCGKNDKASFQVFNEFLVGKGYLEKKISHKIVIAVINGLI